MANPTPAAAPGLLAGCAAVAFATATALAATLFWKPQPRLLWNASSSSPVGLYLITSADQLHTGEMAVAWAPPAARHLAAARRYVPFSVPLVKRVAAVAGDRVCAEGSKLKVNGRFLVRRRRRDPSGRPLPWWPGCKLLSKGDVLLFSAQAPLAFDGRYFGVTSADQVIGRARLLWPR